MNSRQSLELVQNARIRCSHVITPTSYWSWHQALFLWWIFLISILLSPLQERIFVPTLVPYMDFFLNIFKWDCTYLLTCLSISPVDSECCFLRTGLISHFPLCPLTLTLSVRYNPKFVSLSVSMSLTCQFEYPPTWTLGLVIWLALIKGDITNYDANVGLKNACLQLDSDITMRTCSS